MSPKIINLISSNLMASLWGFFINNCFITVPMNVTALISHISGIVQYVFLWLAYFTGTMSSSFHSCHTAFCLSLHPLIVIWVVSTFWLLWAIFCEHSCTGFCAGHMLSIILDLLTNLVCLLTWHFSCEQPPITLGS